MHQSIVDKLDDFEKLPLMQRREFDQGLVNYMVRNQPLFKKVSFIRKTYSILSVWLSVSFWISYPFMRDPQSTLNWLSRHSWILWISSVVLFLQISFYLLMAAFLCTGQRMMLLGYLKMLGSVPLAILWSLLYVSSFTVVVDSALAAYGWAALSYCFLYTLIAVLGVLLYTFAVRTADFKQLYAYIVPLATAVSIWLFIIASASATTNRLEHFVALVLSVMLGWIVVFDTQLIFGAKMEKGRKYPYQGSMYWMSAYEMYFDLFIHFYLGALNLFPAGERDDPLSA